MTQGAGTRRRASSGGEQVELLYPAVGVDRELAGWEADGVFQPAGCRVHLVGVGGCGMRGAARVLMRAGAVVSGSDRSESGALSQLADAGADIHVGQSGENLPSACDLVVHSAAIPDSNPELVSARARGLKIIKYAELLGLLMSREVGIAVAGTHGKSTTTAMVSYVLREAGLDPSFVIGAGVEQLQGGSGVGDGDHFIVEACEYDRSFLNLRPKIATILNIEEDHLDYYSGIDEIIEAFGAFTSRVPADGLLLVNGQDENAMKAVAGAGAMVETFGLDGAVDWRAELGESEQGCQRFSVYRHGHLLTDVEMSLPGRHNVANALAAMAICFHCGVDPTTIARLLGRFRGAHRRLTHRGSIAGVNVVDDYAHHPTEIRATLEAARAYYQPRKLHVVFQPHQHSRTRFLLDDFAETLEAADVVVVPDIYFVRDSESERGLIDANDLVERIKENRRKKGQTFEEDDARYQPVFTEIAAQLCEEVEEGDLVLTMGAGNVWQVADALLRCLSRTRSGAGEVVFMGDEAEH
jgi:UDP-N-acetylmuramate--alanine ligase